MVFSDKDSSYSVVSRVSCSGYCSTCSREHSLGEGAARNLCFDLMQKLEIKKRIDLDASDEQADPRCSSDYLFGSARGQMFGVMEYRGSDGNYGTAKAFSGQYNGIWKVPGWVPPVVDTEAMERISVTVEHRIKELGRKIGCLEKDAPQREIFVRERRDMSRQLMKEIHRLYTVTNFRGQTRSLGDIFLRSGGMPTGTGDCCAPKLLHYAAVHRLIPLGIVEFYWGRENRSKTRQHGHFYHACKEKCQPILGFMLCGLTRVRHAGYKECQEEGYIALGSRNANRPRE